MENDNAGADVVGTLFTVFVILLITDFLCLTRIYNFTRCVGYRICSAASLACSRFAGWRLVRRHLIQTNG
jgi:hypothetical protein